jgi:galactose-1-phosphate uridylyltransferase
MARKDTKESVDTRDTSSLSSATLESQKLEEIDLKVLVNRVKESTKGNFAQNINVALSQDSAYALFWTHLSIQIWDVSTIPPSFKDSVSTEGFCVLATIAGKHLAYMVGDRDHRLTVGGFAAQPKKISYFINV